MTLAPLLALALAGAPAAAGAPMSVHEFQVKTIDGKDVSLASYRGKALLIVNTASQCGFTPQYKGLEELYQAYRARGLEVLAFPSNDFGGQEPGSAEEIKKFCELRYKTTFPLFAKVGVRGDDAHPLFRFLQAQPTGGKVGWNFGKFVIDREGHVVAYHASAVEPGAPELRKQIEALLPRT